MGVFVCKNGKCLGEFKSKHSTAQYCSRRCSLACVGLENLNKSNPERIFTDEDLLKKLVEIANSLGKTPTKDDIRNMKIRGFSPCVLRERFGTYTAAVITAGLKQNVVYYPLQSLPRVPKPGLRFFILQRDGFKCHYCGGNPQNGYVLQVDHIIPVSKGGLTTKDNLVTSCSLCNLGKSDNLLF